MRLAIRAEDGRVLTLWLPDGHTVRDVKLAIAESGRSAIACAAMRLLDGADELPDATPVGQMRGPRTGKEAARVRAGRRRALTPDLYISIVVSQPPINSPFT